MAKVKKPITKKDEDAFDLPERSKKGKKVFIVILLIIFFSVAAGGGVWYWQNRKFNQQKAELQKQIDELNKKLQESASNQSNQTKIIDKDWLSYTDQYEGLTFNYPSNWKLEKIDKTKEAKSYNLSWKGPFQDIVLTSPNGFKLKMQSHIEGIGGGCDPDTNCPTVNVLSVDAVTKLKNGDTLYLVKEETSDHDGKNVGSRTIGLYAPPKGGSVIKTGKFVGFPPYILFPSQGVDGALTAFSGPASLLDSSSNKPNFQLNLTASQYFDQQDLQIASDILSSVHY